MTEGVVAGHCDVCGYGFPDPVEASAQPADSSSLQPERGSWTSTGASIGTMIGMTRW
jgi:hypothetical protein